jgi:hypothetical protein
MIETKCFKGWIFGDEKSRVWTQSLSVGGRWFSDTEKHTFQNPTKKGPGVYPFFERESEFHPDK